MYVDFTYYKAKYLNDYVPSDLIDNEEKFNYFEKKAFTLVDQAVYNFLSQVGVDQILEFDDIDGKELPYIGHFLKQAISAQVEFMDKNESIVQITRSAAINVPGVAQVEGTAEVLWFDRLCIEAQNFIRQTGIPQLFYLDGFSKFT